MKNILDPVKKQLILGKNKKRHVLSHLLAIIASRE
ncbi:hypothetical protein SAMN05421825_0175 [Epilithonimonas hungarica]|uniref:Uncharacterized protein n=1 Tax=Epilithonimonas hungarica TaxID=454006 RepID=A0A1G7FPJ4_9FLAO|nr:hypothetical protein SAMN05421825_0175 [Epilithonimonas hungarica]